MGIVGKCIRDLRKETITHSYAEKNRYIPQDIYTKLKSKKECDYCQKGFGKTKPEIHHIVRVEDGGSNEESNLMAVHFKCHQTLDSKNKIRR